MTTPTVSAIDALTQKLKAGGRVWLDAGTGTELQARGVPMHPAVWCGVAHMSHPDVVRAIHIDYINAGVDVITANTFSTNRNMMGPAGLGDQVADTNRRAIELALEARQIANSDRPIVVAGSMSHQIPIKRGTNQRQQRALPEQALVRENFDEIANLLRDAGADMIIMEMMSDPALAKPAIEAAVATGLPVWLGLSCKADDNEELISYSIPEVSFDHVCQTLISPDISVAGIMHSSINDVPKAIDTIRKYWSGPTMAYPDSGHFTMPDWHFEDVIPPADFGNAAKEWSESGVQVLGGCCGLGVDHIDAMVKAAS